MSHLRLPALLGSIAFLATVGVAFAWTGPTASPPSSNVSAPVNVGSAYQEKSGSLWVDGGIGINAGQNLCIGVTCISSLSGLGQWTTSGSSIYYNGGNVGIGISSPQSIFHVRGGNGVPASSGNMNTGVIFSSAAGGPALNLGAYNSGAVPTSYSFMSSAYENNAGVFVPLALQPNGGSVGIGVANPGSNTKLEVLSTLPRAIEASNQGATDWTACFGSDCTGGISTLYGVYANGSLWAGYFTGPVLIGGSGLYNSAGYQMLQGNATDWLRINQNQSYTYGIAVYSNVALGTGGLAVGGWTNPGAGNISATGNVTAGAFLYNSDERLKKDIAPLTDNLSKVLQMEPVSYLWRDPSRGTGTQIGFIAQNVQRVVPQLVHTDASTTLESVDYSRMTPLLVGSVQELNQKIEDQQTQIDTQQRQIDSLKAEIEAMQGK